MIKNSIIERVYIGILHRIVNWGKYREENGRLIMPVSVRLNHAIADGYLVAKVFKLLEEEIRGLKEICHGKMKALTNPDKVHKL